jgi:hypothetical protein
MCMHRSCQTKWWLIIMIKARLTNKGHFSSQEIKTSQLYPALVQNIYASKYSVHIDVESL